MTGAIQAKSYSGTPITLICHSPSANSTGQSKAPYRRISPVGRHSAQTTVRNGSAVAPYAGSPTLSVPTALRMDYAPRTERPVPAHAIGALRLHRGMSGRSLERLALAHLRWQELASLAVRAGAGCSLEGFTKARKQDPARPPVQLAAWQRRPAAARPVLTDGRICHRAWSR